MKAGLWDAVNTDKVRPFVWIYYLALWVWGIYGTFFAAPVTYVQPVMGEMVYDWWVWLNIIGTSMVMISLYFEPKAARHSHCRTREYLLRTLIQIQTGGHACMFFVLLAYEYSAIDATSWGQGTYSVFVIWPYVIGCLLLTVQGIVKIVTNHPEEVQ